MNGRNIIGSIGKILRLPKAEIRILMYHRVNPRNDLPDNHISVTPEAFERQMLWIKENNWQVISLESAVRQLKSGTVQSNKQIVITFDDGYQDNYQFAYPILRRFKFPAIIFLAVQACFNNEDEFLNLLQMKEMLSEDISFGAHTVTHPFLTEISYYQSVKEIFESKQILEEKLNIPIQSFAYPAGYFNQHHRYLTMQADYECALSIRPGGNRPGEDLYALRRTEIARHDSLLDFKNKLQGGFDMPHLVRQYLTGLYPAPQI